MKYRKRSLISGLLAGLTVLISACGNRQHPQLELISANTLTDFPSASAIEYDGNGKFYLFGDDAPYLLVMDTNYRVLDRVRYSMDTAFRISKASKTDIESATLIDHNGEKHLYALSSLSDSGRMKLYYFPLSDPHTYLSINYSSYAKSLSALPEINIEGLAVLEPNFILANRANKTHPQNKLIVTGDQLNRIDRTPPRIIGLELDSTKVIGVSGLYYLKEKDLLLFTASEEDTPSAVQDGTINDSYLGWVTEFSKKTEERTIRPAEMIRLSSVHSSFIKQKVESVCVLRTEADQLVLQLVSDNDNGQSGLFRVRLRIN